MIKGKVFVDISKKKSYFIDNSSKMKQLMKSRRMSQTTKSVRSDVNRKAISDNNLKNMCYCLYYNLMVFDKTATIVLSANPRTSGKNEISDSEGWVAEPDLPVSVQESPAEAWVNSGLPWGQEY